MKQIKQTIGATVISAALILVSGCDTVNKLVNVNGQPMGNWFGNLMAQISPQQQAQLQAQSPQTLAIIQHNDQVAKQQQQAAAAPVSGQPAAAGQPAASGQPAPSGQPAAQPAQAADAPMPLKVDDIKAMTSAGIKAQSIIDAIKESKTTYTQADIDAAQRSTPPVDASVIAFMKNPTG